jgi:hypothetical protein
MMSFENPAWLGPRSRSASSLGAQSTSASVSMMIRSANSHLTISRLLQGVVWALLLGCKSSAGEPSGAAPTSEPERFSFTLPGGYVPVELRGEGSERLRAPVGASVTRGNKGFKVSGGADFELDVAPDAPALAELGGGGVAPIVREPDLLIFKLGAGYSFVVLRELVPEWDEGARQRIACGSAGGAVSQGATRADARVFSKAAVENMVAACRSLELPRLE